jgi:hypothetical protein
MSPRTIRRSGRAVLTSIAAAVVVLAGVSAPASAAAQPMTLSVNYGPTGGGGLITGTVPAASALFPAYTVPTVQFQYIGAGTTPCGAMAKAVTQITGTGTTTTAGALTVNPTAVKRMSSTKILFQVPPSAYPALDDLGNPSSVNPNGLVLVGAQISAKWNVCVYDSDSTTSSTLLASSLYTLVLRPTITSIVPASSPAGGGQSITVNGTGFTQVPIPITGSIGGAALTNIKVATNGNSFTATTGPRAAGTGLAVSVKTPGGTVSSLDPDNNGLAQDGNPATNDAPIPFSYGNGIRITPNTAAVDELVTVDVYGAGFSLVSFDTFGSPTSTLAHVFLVNDGYVAASNRGVAECVVEVVVSDTELVCTLDLSAYQLSPADSSMVVPNVPIADGAYILTVVTDGATNAASNGNPSIISSGAAFVVAPY